MRAPLLALLFAVPLLAGCATDEAPATLATVQTARLTGVVTTLALEPLPGARILVTNAAGAPIEGVAPVADQTGQFDVRLPLGEYVVVARHDGYVSAAQRARLDGADVSLSFTLKPKPTETPSQRVYEAHGLIVCAFTVKTGDGHGEGAAQSYNCGSNDPNNRQALDFVLDPDSAITGVVIELVWAPVTDAAKWFRLHALRADAAEEELGESEGERHVRIVLPPAAAAHHFAGGGVLRAVAEPAGAFLDEESPADAGLAFEQPFTVYVTTFSIAPPDAGYSVLG